MYNREYTPERITELKPNKIFVFGSNLAGAHGGGAARLAYDRFGAIRGQGIHNRFIDSFDHDADRTEW